VSGIPACVHMELDWKTHGSEYYECSRYKENPNIANESAHAQAREALKKYIFYFERVTSYDYSIASIITFPVPRRLCFCFGLFVDCWVQDQVVNSRMYYSQFSVRLHSCSSVSKTCLSVDILCILGMRICSVKFAIIPTAVWTNYQRLSLSK